MRLPYRTIQRLAVLAFFLYALWMILPVLTSCSAEAQTGEPLSGPPDQAALETLSERYARRSVPLLRELLSIPNDAHFPEHVERNVAFMGRVLRERGFAVRKLDTGGPPLLLAELPSRGASRTVLIYLQIDGQPVDPSSWEQSDPWVPVLKQRRGDAWEEIPWSRLDGEWDADWRIFARSASDAKGPVAMFLAALDATQEAELSPTHHIKLILDFEEELGSPHLPAAVERYRNALAADLLVIYDGPRHLSNRPTLTFGARGIATVTLTVFGPRAPQHSGHYGNYAPNPAQRLAALLASMKDDRGRVTIPGFYDGIEIDEETRRILEQVPDDESAMRERLGIAAPDSVAPTYQESLQYPSLNVRGLRSAWVGDEVRTIVPSEAIAEIDVRLTLESDAERLVGLIRDHLSAQGYVVLDGVPSDRERAEHPRLVRFESEISYGAFRTPFDSEGGRWLTAALDRAFGGDPIRIRTSGGSIPIAPFVQTLGIPAITVPTVNRDNNQHSPNENLRLGNFVEGIRTYLAVLTEPFPG